MPAEGAPDHVSFTAVAASLRFVGLRECAEKVERLPGLTPSNGAYCSDVLHAAFVIARRAAHCCASLPSGARLAELFAVAASCCHAAADGAAAVGASRGMRSPGLFLAAARRCAELSDAHAAEVARLSRVGGSGTVA